MSEKITFTLAMNDLASGQLMQFAKTGQTVFDNLNRQAEGLQDKVSGISSLGAGISGIAGMIGGLVGGFAAFDGITGIAKMAMDAEQTHIAFETMLGSTVKATAALADLKQFANTTPFESEEVTKSGRSLLAYGFAVNELLPNLKAVGDVAAGTQVPLTDLANIFGKARVAGRLYAEDVNQLTERGVPIIDELAKVFKTSAGEVKKLVEQGAVGFPQLQQAFANMSGEGGRFFNLMEKQSVSTGGKWSTFTDLIKERALGIGTDLLPATNSLIDFGTTVLQNIDYVKGLAGIAAAGTVAWYGYTGAMTAYTAITKAGGLYTAAMTAGQWALNFALSANPVGVVVGGLVAFSAAIYTAYQKSETFRGAVWGLWDATKTVFSSIASLGKNVFGSLSDIIIGTFTMDEDQLKRGMMGLKDAAVSFGQDISKTGDSFRAGQKAGIADFAKDQAAKASDTGGNTGLLGLPKAPGTTLGGVSGGGKPGASGLGAGIAGVQGNAASRTLNISIQSLMSGDIVFQNTTVQESGGKIKELVNQALIEAVRDFELVAA